VVGLVLARAVGDAAAGAVVAGCALPYALLGGLLIGGAGRGGLGGASGLLVGSAAAALVAVIGYVAVAALPRLFAAGAVGGAFGVLAAGLELASMSPTAAAAVTLTVAVGIMPVYPVLAARLGRLPFPVLPQRAEEMLADRPEPGWSQVFGAVARTADLLTGLLWGAAGVAVAAVVVLLLSRNTSAAVLATTATLALLLRARLYPNARLRLPLLGGGVAGGLGLLLALPPALPDRPAGLALAVVVAVAGVSLAAGLVYSTRAPTPVLGRLADLTDALCVAALIPITCAVIGLYGYVRALLATVGG
jgi:type VII secretion integral membrane protein EccD